MNDLVLFAGASLPTLIATAGERASYRFFEFFTAQIRNPNTRRAYARAAARDVRVALVGDKKKRPSYLSTCGVAPPPVFVVRLMSRLAS
jgi:hypothetical protein